MIKYRWWDFPAEIPLQGSKLIKAKRPTVLYARIQKTDNKTKNNRATS